MNMSRGAKLEVNHAYFTLYMLALLVKIAIMGCEGEPKGRCKLPLQCV